MSGLNIRADMIPRRSNHRIPIIAQMHKHNGVGNNLAHKYIIVFAGALKSTLCKQKLNDHPLLHIHFDFQKRCRMNGRHWKMHWRGATKKIPKMG